MAQNDLIGTVPTNPSDIANVNAAKSAPIVAGVGVSGLRQFSGYIREEFLLDLTGLPGQRIYQEMASNDATCGAILFAIRNSLTALEWRVDPAEPGNEQAKKAAELVRGMLFDDMSHTWPAFIEQISSMFTYGYAVTEIVWKQRKGPDKVKPWLGSEFDDGLYAPQAFELRGQQTINRWVFDELEHLLGFVQFPWNGPMITVPMSRCMHFTTTSSTANPEGRSLLRTAYRSWYFLKRMQEIEGIGIERDLVGYPVLRVPGNMLDAAATPDQLSARAAYEDMLRKIRRDQNEGVLLPSDRDDKGNLYYDFSLMSSGGSRQVKTDEAITRYAKDIARSVLADFIFLGSDGGGSYALGETKVNVFVQALRGYAHHITEEINGVAINQIWERNGFDPALKPKLEHGDLGEDDLAALGAYIKALAEVGYDVASDAALEQYLRDVADLPPVPERDPERDPASDEYDPTIDPNSSYYDPVLDPNTNAEIAPPPDIAPEGEDTLEGGEESVPIQKGAVLDFGKLREALRRRANK